MKSNLTHQFWKDYSRYGDNIYQYVISNSVLWININTTRSSSRISDVWVCDITDTLIYSDIAKYHHSMAVYFDAIDEAIDNAIAFINSMEHELVYRIED